MRAKDKAVLEHSAAKERMRQIREEERNRTNRPSFNPPPIRDLDGIVDDVQKNRSRDRYDRQSDHNRHSGHDRRNDSNTYNGNNRHNYRRYD